MFSDLDPAWETVNCRGQQRGTGTLPQSSVFRDSHSDWSVELMPAEVNGDTQLNVSFDLGDCH